MNQRHGLTRGESVRKWTSVGFKHASADKTVHTAVQNVYELMETLGNLRAHSAILSSTSQRRPISQLVSSNDSWVLKATLQKLDKLMSEFEERDAEIKVAGKHVET